MESSSDDEKLKKLIRTISRSRMMQLGSAEDVEIKEISGNPSVYSHWMAIILITGPDARFTFKAHFKTKSAQLLAAPLYGAPPHLITQDQAIDCARELINLTAGGIKQSLLPFMELHLSLPIVTRGFDEIFFASHVRAERVEDRWLLARRDSEIICTSTIEWMKPVQLIGLAEDQELASENATEIEYL